MHLAAKGDFEPLAAINCHWWVRITVQMTVRLISSDLPPSSAMAIRVSGQSSAMICTPIAAHTVHRLSGRNPILRDHHHWPPL